MWKKAFLATLMILSGIPHANATKAVPMKCDVPNLQLSFTKSPSPEIMPPSLYIHGTLETPTPNYTYDLKTGPIEEEGVYTYTLKLIAPSGGNATVINKVEINEMLTVGNDIRAVQIGIEKTYNWGPNKVNCQRFVSK